MPIVAQEIYDGAGIQSQALFNPLVSTRPACLLTKTLRLKTNVPLGMGLV